MPGGSAVRSCCRRTRTAISGSFDDDRWEVTESTLTVRDGTYYLHIGFRRHPTETEREALSDETAEHGTVLGVDLGVTNLAVTSTGLFVSGGELTHWQAEYEKRRGSLQQTGTRWAHENIQSVGRKADGRFTILVHEAANAIVEEAIEYDCTHIVFEDLTDIRERLPGATWHHRWAFRKLYESAMLADGLRLYAGGEPRRHGFPVPEVRLRGPRRLQRGEERYL